MTLLDQLHRKKRKKIETGSQTAVADLINAGLQFNMKTDLCQIVHLMAHELDLHQVNQTQL